MPAKKPAKKPPRWPYPHAAPGMHAHASGQWAKKIRGRRVYFGLWGDPAAALKRYQARASRLHDRAGPAASPSSGTDEAVDLDYVVNTWLAAQLARREAGELSVRTYSDYRMVAAWLVDAIPRETLVADLVPALWTEARQRLSERAKSPNSVEKFVTVTRQVFKWADASEIIPRPPRYGPSWRSPGLAAKRKHRARVRHSGRAILTPQEAFRLVSAARPNVRAMILLGLNGGLGASDLNVLDVRDVRGAALEFPRPKTGIERRIPLWPETAAALKAVIEGRTEGRVFVTRHGRPWLVSIELPDGRFRHKDEIGRQFRKLAAAEGVRATFYELRHTFRTIADELPDARAIDRIMGHVTPGISATYVRRIGDDRLKAITDHVRAWFKQGDAERSTASGKRVRRRAGGSR